MPFLAVAKPLDFCNNYIRKPLKDDEFMNQRLLKRVIFNTVMVLSLILFASVLRVIKVSPPMARDAANIFIFAIYVGLLCYWGLNVMKRIMHMKVRRYMLVSCFMMIAWVIVRTIRWYVAATPELERILWYCYYIPQLTLSYCAYMAADTLSEKNEEFFALRKAIISTITIFMGLFVVTNELHGMVFLVTPDASEGKHIVGYYIVASWIALLIFFAILRLPRYTDAHLFNKRKLMPYAVVALGLTYCSVYFFKEIKGMNIFIEYTAAYCVLTIGFWESLILAEMIPSNVEYRWCFNHSGAKVSVVDNKGRTRYASFDARSLTDFEIAELRNNRVIHPNEGTELLSMPIRGGYAIWERDVSDIHKAYNKLLETKGAIKEATSTLEENIEIEKKHQRISAKNHLYDITFSNVSGKLSYMHNLIERAGSEENPIELRKLLMKIDLCGVFVKRKSNLLLLSEQEIGDFTDELRLCFRESFDNLNDAELESSFVFNNISELDYPMADLIYEIFEEAIEAYIDYIKGVTAILVKMDNFFKLTVNLLYKDDVNSPIDKRFKLKDKGEVTMEFENQKEDITLSFNIYGPKEGGNKE